MPAIALLVFVKFVSGISNYAAMYKSYQLMMSDVKRLNSQISVNIYKKSQINYYQYLSIQSCRLGDRQVSLSWLYQILTLDSRFFFKNKLYKQFFKSFLSLIAHPLTSLIWSNHLAWLEFKQKLKPRKSPITIADLNKKVVKRNYKLQKDIKL